MKAIQYFLHSGNAKVAVGATIPSYSNLKKGWITDRGIFPASSPAEYSVTGEVQPDPAPAA